MSEGEQLAGKQVVFLSWRDSGNPESGGAERYLQSMVDGLRDRGAEVTVFSAAYAGAEPTQTVDGVRYVRRGSKLTVYLHGIWSLLRGDLGDPDVVVDVQNGLPFFARLATRRPVVVLVHHVHREQWPVVYPGLTGRIGWWLERVVAPRAFRRTQYVAVSRATRDELGRLGVSPARVAIVHNGTDSECALESGAASTVSAAGSAKAAHPMLAVVGRLVPHKQVEHAVDVAVALRQRWPDLRLHVVGDGWWADELRSYVTERGAGDVVRLEGYVEESRKREVYEQAWLLVLPSLKEGWGLVVSEAGLHETPAVAYHDAGGTTESIVDGVSGMLAKDAAELIEIVGHLLDDTAELQRLGKGAREHSENHSWSKSQEAFATVLIAALEGRAISA